MKFPKFWRLATQGSCMSLTRSWCLALVVALMASVSVAQTQIDGTIEGRVLDSQGLAVPGATVTVSSPALIQTMIVVTSAEGRYRATRLPRGVYSVRVTMDGFSTRELTGIALSVGRVLVINPTIEPGGTAESVTVEAETPVIDTQQVKNVQTITKEVVDQLPLSRDPILGPTQLAPGVVERTVAGSRRNETNFLVDGANQNAPNQGYAEANISWDAVEEIEFITTSNPMENYGAIGGTLNLVTRSGGNRFSGMGSFDFTNRDLNQVILPKEHANTLGVSQPTLKEYERDASLRLGGPIGRFLRGSPRKPSATSPPFRRAWPASSPGRSGRRPWLTPAWGSGVSTAEIWRRPGLR